ncbi:Sphingosine kinase 1 [Hondaea fermentalgiana]|uniref:Sphingosine kinase 1 n=1 Tax=Hondaea fermentalgiana TaxID=2315210 RepID=A0A2R5GG05_9STRA|nr:Sphingosine kinase 1 [Hondaea fermentalgiana]|eukprot:GBG29525.1 Sphingosine kinase 1 [Hondaea fermentalgiana]
MGKSMTTPHGYAVFANEAPQEQGVALKRVLLIVNPKSGNKKGLKIRDKVSEVLVEGGCEVQVVYTEYSGHAKVLAREHDLNGVDVFAPIGGDGTVHETVNGFMERTDFQEISERVAIAIIPGGSGNTLAYDLGLSTPQATARSILAGCVRRIDVNKVTPLAEDEEHKPVYSVNMVGYGLPSTVLQAANSLRWLGGAQYKLAAYISLLRNVGYLCRVEIVDANGHEIVREDKYVMIQGQLTVHMGSRVPFCVQAKLDDGLIELSLVKHASRAKLIKVMTLAESGKSGTADVVEELQVRSFKVTPLEASNKLIGPATVNVDGELVGHAPFEAAVLPGALRFVTPSPTVDGALPLTS